MSFDYRILFTFLTALTYTYLVLCMFRVLMTWFGPYQDHQGFRILHRITAPWMNFFQKLGWLKFRTMDFSPVFALIVLQLLSQVFHFVAITGHLTLGFFLATVIQLLGSAINFFLLFFVVLSLVRLVGLLIRTSSIQRFWFTLDHILQPLVYPLLGMLFPRRVVPYGTGLGIFLGVMIALTILIWFGFGALAALVLPLGS